MDSTKATCKVEELRVSHRLLNNLELVMYRSLIYQSQSIKVFILKGKKET